MSLISDEELARIPVESPRRTDLLPGLRLSRAVSRRSLAFPIGFLLLFALAPLLIVSQDRRASLAVRKTVTAQGRVEHTQATPACGGQEIVYSFSSVLDPTCSSGPMEYRGRDSVCAGSPYSSVQPGDAIPIVYVRGEPETNAIAASRPEQSVLVPLVLFPLFGLVMFAPFFWPRMSQLRRDRRLFARGILAAGRVVFVSRESDAHWPGWPMAMRGEVFVAAKLRSGEQREVVAVGTNDWLLAQLPAGAEVHVCVLGERAVLIENYLR